MLDGNDSSCATQSVGEYTALSRKPKSGSSTCCKNCRFVEIEKLKKEKKKPPTI